MLSKTIRDMFIMIVVFIVVFGSLTFLSNTNRTHKIVKVGESGQVIESNELTQRELLVELNINADRIATALEGLNGKINVFKEDKEFEGQRGSEPKISMKKATKKE